MGNLECIRMSDRKIGKRIKALVVLALSMMSLTTTSFASKEVIVSANMLTFRSNGFGRTGPISIDVEASDSGSISMVKISAFGKTEKLNIQELQKIPKSNYNGIYVTYESGYKEVGGHTLYIVLTTGLHDYKAFETMMIFTETLPIEIFEKKKREHR